ncbi:MAG: preprotein translocase subunit YajC, partial [Planctomycetota bacterium]
MSYVTLILAQEVVPAPTGSKDATSALLLPALMFGVVTFLILTSRSQKKREQRTLADMYSRMGKNDRVLTVGGIIGTVISVKDNEVVLKVDEST